MNTLNGYPTSREEEGQFTIQLSFEDEFLSPYEVYDINDEYGKEDIQNVVKGKYTWAIAIVTVFKNGIELARNTLGCCEYNWDNMIEEFKQSGYYDDMKDETIREAKQTLKERNHHEKTLFKINVINNEWTLQNIKDLYYAELALGIESRGFDQYLSEQFQQVYDVNLQFLGYETK